MQMIAAFLVCVLAVAWYNDTHRAQYISWNTGGLPPVAMRKR